jgi:monoamine oxidase
MGGAVRPNVDLAIIGGGVAGTFVARRMRQNHPDWSIALFERTKRIGGRLHSVPIDGLDHPIELGGMRFLTSQRRIASLVKTFELPTHPFDPTGGAPERSYLRGIVGAGGDGDDAGRGYDLEPELRGRSALDLGTTVFRRIVPGFQGLDHEGYARWRATGRLLERPVTEWAIGEALEAILGVEGKRFVTDAFGYDSGMRAFCAPDLVEFLFHGGDPAEQALTPNDGMDRIPRELAAHFERNGGDVRHEHELVSLAIDDGVVALRFSNGGTVLANQVVLATALPALRLLAANSSVLQSERFDDVLDSVEAFPAMKLYLWYEEAWWRPTVPGIRATTDLPVRKVFYFDGTGGSLSALLGMYTDGLDVRPWADLYEGAAAGAPAPPTMLAEVQRILGRMHPEVGEIPLPIGSALAYWGADAHETGWHFWRSGVNSDEVLDRAPQPDPRLPIYLANEAFSRRQSWVEGALEGAEAVVDRLSNDRVRSRDSGRARLQA